MKKRDVPKAEADIKDLKSSRLSAITAMRQFRFADDLKKATPRNHLIKSLPFRSAQQSRREIKMAYMTFAIVFSFLSLNLPRIAIGGYEVSQTWLILHCVKAGAEYMPNLTFYYWDEISRLLMVVNSAINFLIYCTGNDQFKVHF